MPEFQPFALNIRGRLKKFNSPAVMGIVNVTSDSFYEGSRTFCSDSIRKRASEMIGQGVDIIDIGAYSTRPGAEPVPEEKEAENLKRAIGIIRELSTEIPVSVDTFRSKVAKTAIREGADIINDISGGDLDSDMFDTVAELKVPYILMHTRGTPQTMNSLTDYGERGVTATVLDDLGFKMNRLALKGVNDIIIDPGFGFAKNLDQNYELMRNLNVFSELDAPVLVGISRKRMVTNLLGITAEEALEATVSLNSFALDRGASVLRVHDTLPAIQAVRIFNKLNKS